LPEGIVGLQVGYYKGGKVGSYKKGHTWSMPHFDGLPVLYCNDNGSDERFVTQAIFNLQVVTPPSVYTGTTTPTDNQVNLVLELWSTYDCEFFVPDITESFADAPDRLQLRAGPTPFGNFTMADMFYFDSGMTTKDSGIKPNIPGFFWGSWNGADHIGILNRYGMDAVSSIAIMYGLSTNSSGGLSGLSSVTPTPGGVNIISGFRYGMCGNGALDACYFCNIDIAVPGVPHNMTPASGGTIHINEEDGTTTVITCDGSQVFDANFEAVFAFTGGDLTASGNIVATFRVAVTGYGNSASTLLARSAGPQTLEGYARRKFEELDMSKREKFGSVQGFYQYLHDELHPRRDPQLPDIEDIISRHRHPSGKADGKERKEDAGLELASLRVCSSPPPTPNSGVVLERLEHKAVPAPTPSGANKPLVKKSSTK